MYEYIMYITVSEEEAQVTSRNGAAIIHSLACNVAFGANPPIRFSRVTISPDSPQYDHLIKCCSRGM